MVQLDGPSADQFPVNPQHMFSNLKAQQAGDGSNCSVLAGLCWLRYDCAAGLLTVQHVFHATVEAPLDLRRFPYDSHVLPFELSLRGFDVPGSSTRKHSTTAMSPPCPSAHTSVHKLVHPPIHQSIRPSVHSCISPSVSVRRWALNGLGGMREAETITAHHNN